MRIILSLVLMLVLAGCAVPVKQLTKEEFSNLTTKYYENVSVEKALNSATRIASNLSPNTKVSYEDEKQIVTRTFALNVLLASVSGNYYYDIQVEEVSNETVKVTVQMYRQLRARGWSPTSVLDIPRDQIHDPSDYNLFWKRLDYYLGKTADWITCEGYKSLSKEALVPRGNLLAMCDMANVQSPDYSLNLDMKHVSRDDVTGTYSSYITSNSTWFFGKVSYRNIVISLVQDGSIISGHEHSTKSEIFDATRNGDLIEFKFWSGEINRGSTVTGRWEVNSDGTKLEGNWSGGSNYGGIWDLTRIE